MVVYAVAGSTPWLDRTAVTVCGTAPSGSHALLLGLVLLTLTHGLARRRQVAWILGLALVVWSALTEVESLAASTPGEPWRLVPLTLATVALVRARDRFVVSPDPHRLRQAAAVGAASGATLLLFGGGGLFAERGRFAAPLSTADLGREFFAAVAANSGRVGFDGPTWLRPGLAVAGGLALIAVLLTLSAAAPPPDPADVSDRAAMRRLISHPDADTLAPFALRYDKTYAFEPQGRAAIGYRVLAGMAVAGGDPIGARDAWPAAIDTFLAEAEQRGWRPAVLGAGPEASELWAARGMRGLGIGDEVIVDVASFSLSGRAMRNVRQAVRRTENAGIWASVVLESELTPELSAQLRRIHRAWLGKGTARRPRPDADMIPQGREHGFAMNLDAMAEGKHPDSLFVIAFAADGYAVAFQRYLLVADAGSAPALTLDVMPRHRIAPNGVNERLIAETIEYAATHGYKTVSLNFAAFRTILEAHWLANGAPGAPPRPGLLARMTRRAIHLLDPLIQVESLYRFNAKFQPSWQPRSVLLASWLDVPLFGVAAFGLEFALPYDRRRSRIAAPRLEPQPRPEHESEDEAGLIPGNPELAGAARQGTSRGQRAQGVQAGDSDQGPSSWADQANWSAVQRHSNRP